jgi:hypothetical protein
MRDKADEARLLDNLRSDIAKPVEGVRAQLARRDVLIRAGIKPSVPEAVTQPKRRSEALLDKFRAQPFAATLTKGKGWTQLVADLQLAATEFDGANVAAWRAYREQLFGGDSPSTIRARIAMTKGNAEAFQQYESLYVAFRKLFEQLPGDLSDVAIAERLANKLRETSSCFDFDVPSEVKIFLEAVQADGASIEMLTDEVRLWLKNNNAMKSYRVRAVSR